MPVYFYSAQGQYGCFSNFSRHGFELDGRYWPTSEHYFQAQKFVGTPHLDEVRRASTPKEAARRGRERHRPLRLDWEQVKDDVMRRAVRRKFETHADIRAILLATGDDLLVENAPGDYYWGCGADGSGQNKLGQILMEVRSHLQNAVAKTRPSLAFAKHLPPSAGLPRVLALDADSAADLPPEIDLMVSPDTVTGPFDAIVGTHTFLALAELQALLRPGGRLILATQMDSPDNLLASLTSAGFIHCLVETNNGFSLYRGERPAIGSTLERHANLLSSNHHSPFLFLLITQSPNKPAWKLSPDEKLEWRAATVLDPQTNAPTLLAFTSLVKAVAFMQPAVLAKRIGGVNKIGKFPAASADSWGLPFILNPNFDDWRDAQSGPALAVDPQVAITGDE